nr:MAG: DNA pilot protein [Microviridae sp.]
MATTFDPIGSIANGVTAGVSGQLGKEVGYGIGNLTGYNNDVSNDQLVQTDALDKIQAKYNQAATLFAYNLNSPTNQVNRLEAAGLNPGLIYGGTGAGGSTIQAMPTEGAAASNESERQQTDNQSAGMGIQTLKAQSEINANQSGANLNQAKVPEAQANTENIQANTIRTNLLSDYQTIQNDIASATQDTVVDIATGGLNKINQEVTNLINTNSLTTADISKVSAETANAVVDTMLKKTDIKLNTATINKISSEIATMKTEQLTMLTNAATNQANASTEQKNAITKQYEVLNEQAKTRIDLMLREQGLTIEQQKIIGGVMSTALGATILGGFTTLKPGNKYSE